MKALTTQRTWRLARLINLALIYVSNAPSNDNIAVLMRFIEIFTNIYRTEPNEVALSIYKYLITRNYYGHLRKLCDARIPPLMSETVKAPTPMAETIYGLIMIPFSLQDFDQQEFGSSVLTNLTDNFLSTEFSEQVDLYIVPALSHEKAFPYSLWNKVLESQKKVSLSETTTNTTTTTTTKRTPWLLYSFLKLGSLHLGQNSIFDVHCYLNVLSDLTGAILKSKNIAMDTTEDNEMSDEEDDRDQKDVEMTEIENRNAPSSVINRSVSMLNDPGVVNSLVSAIEKSPDEALALTALCKLCHNLLLSDPLALHHFRLLYTLAFRPVFLHRLWNLILDTKRPALMGSSVPLLTVISRGIRLSTHERDAIVPLLAVFASLFCYLLVTIHDTEFYGDEVASGGTSKVWMPFSLQELVPMSLSLRDVGLGLIELAFPQSRPAVKEEYQLAVK